LQKRWQLALWLVLALVAATSMWFYVDRILVGHQVTEAAANDRPRGNLSDLYPRWLGARELLLHHRNPYSEDVALEIQQGYYGRALDPARPGDPKDRQGFAYPVYVVFLLAPLIGLSFHTVQLFFYWLLIALTAATVPLWLRALGWRLPCVGIAIGVALMLGSVPAVQGIKLQQLSLLVAALLAGSAACVASGYLFCGGAILALATIKPQLAWPMVLWFLVWAISDWKVRRRLVFSFVAFMGALLIGSELVLPGWLNMFRDAIRQYHQYTQNESVLDQLVNWFLGPHGGQILAALACLASMLLLWKLRHEAPGSAGFPGALAVVLGLTVLVVPMYAPYNQVLLLPAILFLARDQAAAMTESRSVRPLSWAAGLALAWQWIASLGLSALWFVSRDAALSGWKTPFYATFALPVLIFALAMLTARYPGSVLRAHASAE
jgi:Glycosyltransferase family 87